MNQLKGFEMMGMWDREVRKVVSMDGDGQWICSDEKDDEINRLMGIKKNDYMHGGMRGEYGNECEKVAVGMMEYGRWNGCVYMWCVWEMWRLRSKVNGYERWSHMHEEVWKIGWVHGGV